VLFTTAYARDAIVHHGRLDAGVELITKPFTLHDLAARVERVLASDAAQAFWSRHRTAAP
jgi:DNA-binding response OmpR family regulator